MDTGRACAPLEHLTGTTDTAIAKIQERMKQGDTRMNDAPTFGRDAEIPVTRNQSTLSEREITVLAVPAGSPGLAR